MTEKLAGGAGAVIAETIVGGLVDLVKAIVAKAKEEAAKDRTCRKCRNLQLRQSVYRCFVTGTLMPPSGPPWGECSFWEQGIATGSVARKREG
jgi:hypothetical protein